MQLCARGPKALGAAKARWSSCIRGYVVSASDTAAIEADKATHEAGQIKDLKLIEEAAHVRAVAAAKAQAARAEPGRDCPKRPKLAGEEFWPPWRGRARLGGGEGLGGQRAMPSWRGAEPPR
ncbi:MAG: hypothetical protein R3D78_04770 [Paracoccaceae bacterium]